MGGQQNCNVNDSYTSAPVPPIAMVSWLWSEPVGPVGRSPGESCSGLDTEVVVVAWWAAPPLLTPPMCPASWAPRLSPRPRMGWQERSMVFEWGWPPAHDKGEKRSRSKVLEAVCVRVLCAVHVFFFVHFEAFSAVDHIIGSYYFGGSGSSSPGQGCRSAFIICGF